VSQEERRNAKAINFGIIYGLSAFGLSKQIGVSRSEAKNYIEEYFLMYPGIKEYMEFTKDFLQKNGYVKTLLGRKINIKDYNSKNPMIRNYAERQAINAPIQGTAADIIKRAMIKLYKIKHQDVFSKTAMLLQVHDELVFETAENNIENIKAIIVDIMMNAHKPLIKLDIPLAISVGEGRNWEEAH
jgi:DNA polymerase-1